MVSKMNVFLEDFRKGGGHLRSKKFCFKIFGIGQWNFFGGIIPFQKKNCCKQSQHFFPKKGRGGVKGSDLTQISQIWLRFDLDIWSKKRQVKPLIFPKISTQKNIRDYLGIFPKLRTPQPPFGNSFTKVYWLCWKFVGDF